MITYELRGTYMNMKNPKDTFGFKISTKKLGMGNELIELSHWHIYSQESTFRVRKMIGDVSMVQMEDIEILSLQIFKSHDDKNYFPITTR